MKFTLSWLKEYLDTAAPVETIAYALTTSGIEVENLEDQGKALAPFVIAQILDAQPHPNADKLRVCKVDSGEGILDIVCGAPNARAGIKVVLAKEGAVIPNGNFVIKKSKIRGVESNGMLCSGRELGLSEDHDGIMELPADAPIGKSFAKTMGYDDVLFDVAITPNRGDCLAIRGIARDLAAAKLGALKPLDIEKVEGSFASPITVTLKDKHCPMFVGRYIKNVKNGESPEWLKKRLASIGLRPISTLVDITNYFTVALGRPLHVFDADTLKGNLTVHPADGGETMLALNDKEYTAKAGMTLISDSAGVQSLGGIMGGKLTGCTEATKNVFLEVAYFDPGQIARTGRELAIDSDARHRFERGVDPAFLEDGAELATKMILDLCGGEASKLTIAGAPVAHSPTITFDLKRIATLGGVDVPHERAMEILHLLGFAATTDGAHLKVRVPSWRREMEGQADLVEEIIRIHGYDHIPATPLPRPKGLATKLLTPAQRRTANVRRLLADKGMAELCTWAFCSSDKAKLFGGGSEELTLANPISSDLDAMRPSILPHLIDALAKNAARGAGDLSFFEVGAAYENTSPEGQRWVATGLRGGNASAKGPHQDARAWDAFDAKADALDVLALAGLPAEKVQISQGGASWYHPGRSGTISLGGKIILGWFGEIHPAIAKAFDVKQPMAAFEVFLDRIPEAKAKATKTRPPLVVSDFQAVTRDFAFIVDENVAAADIVKAVKAAEKTLLESVDIFDAYSGPGMEPGKKSLALTVTLRAADRTLTETEIEAAAGRIVTEVGKATGASLRGGISVKAA